jgi:transposase
LIDSPEYKVLLPERILEQRQMIKSVIFRQLVMNYMERYPHYTVNRVEGDFAVCSRKIDYLQNKKRGKGV